MHGKLLITGYTWDAIEGITQKMTKAALSHVNRYIPAKDLLMLEEMHEMAQRPRIGSYDNFLWSTIQVNTANPVMYGSPEYST